MGSLPKSARVLLQTVLLLPFHRHHTPFSAEALNFHRGDSPRANF